MYECLTVIQILPKIAGFSLVLALWSLPECERPAGWQQCGNKFGDHVALS
jgi:hypothetical protein